MGCPDLSLADRLEAINAARQLLARGSIPCAERRLTRSGEPSAWFGDRLVEVERFVVSDAKMDDWARVEMALPTLGRIHSLLVGVDLGETASNPEFANHIGPGEEVFWATKASERISGWSPMTAEARLADQTLDLAERVHEAELQAGAHRLPRQLVHGDFWDNNVLFRARRVVLVTDLDFMGARSRVDDLALTLFFAGLSLAATPAGLLRRLPRLVASYEGGLERPLNDAERAALPLAIARQPLWAAGRWLAILDDEIAARRLAAAVPPEIAWARAILRDVARWRDAL